MARSRRRGVKLPPSGKITKQSFSSRLLASSPTSESTLLPDPGFVEMNRLGSRLSSTPMAGSQARVSLSTTRGSRWYQCIRA